MLMGGKPTEGGPGPVVRDGQVLESSTPASGGPDDPSRRSGHCEDCPVADAWDLAHGVRCGTCGRLLTP